MRHSGDKHVGKKALGRGNKQVDQEEKTKQNLTELRSLKPTPASKPVVPAGTLYSESESCGAPKLVLKHDLIPIGSAFQLEGDAVRHH